MWRGWWARERAAFWPWSDTSVRWAWTGAEASGPFPPSICTVASPHVCPLSKGKPLIPLCALPLQPPPCSASTCARVSWALLRLFKQKPSSYCSTSWAPAHPGESPQNLILVCRKMRKSSSVSTEIHSRTCDEASLGRIRKNQRRASRPSDMRLKPLAQKAKRRPCCAPLGPLTHAGYLIEASPPRRSPRRPARVWSPCPPSAARPKAPGPPRPLDPPTPSPPSPPATAHSPNAVRAPFLLLPSAY